MSSFQIFNRFDQDEVVLELSDFAKFHFLKRNFIPTYRIFVAKIVVVVILILSLLLGNFLKPIVIGVKLYLIVLVLFFIAVIIVGKKLRVHNGTLIGEYKFD